MNSIDHRAKWDDAAWDAIVELRQFQWLKDKPGFVVPEPIKPAKPVVERTESLMDIFERRGAEYLASGCYGRVYSLPGNAWVVKKARNDGTRVYLEWVMHRTAIGRRMRGMPIIDFLVDGEEGSESYIVGMKRYEKRKEEGQDLFLPAARQIPYIKRLIEAFEEETGIGANDCHGGNFLLDKSTKTVILTDPSSSCYRRLGSLKEHPDMFKWVR